MAFPASNGALSDALETACRQALAMKAQAEREVARMATNNVGASYILTIDTRLRGYRADFERIRNISGIASYAQSQLGSPTLDVAAEFNAMIAAIDGVTAWIRANFPIGSGGAAGYLLSHTWGADGPVERQFTPAQTAGLRAELDALIATVA